MRNRTISNQRSALDTARVEALRTRLARRGSLSLTEETYRDLRWDGLSRRDVDRALEAMVAAREAIIEANTGKVRVRLQKIRRAQ
jgi:hypothetical protein